MLWACDGAEHHDSRNMSVPPHVIQEVNRVEKGRMEAGREGEQREGGGKEQGEGICLLNGASYI